MVYKQTPNEVIVRSDDRVYSLEDIFSGSLDSYLKHCWEYAVLAEHVYKNFSPDEQLEKDRTVEQWIHLSSVDEMFSNLLSTDCMKASKSYLRGLKFQTFYRETEKRILVAYVFRGTRFKILGDWFSNFHWIYRYIPFVPKDYYQQVIDLFSDHVANVENFFKTNPKTLKHITVGHSLGGGLAQQAAYSVEQIKLSYVYDSSPVTGYFSLCKRCRLSSCTNMRIYRFYEHGEILAYLRAITQILYLFNFKPNINPLVVEIRTNLSSGNPVKQHGIDIHRAIGNVFKYLKDEEKLSSLKRMADELKKQVK